jgi:hypothetical protein
MAIYFQTTASVKPTHKKHKNAQQTCFNIDIFNYTHNTGIYKKNWRIIHQPSLLFRARRRNLEYRSNSESIFCNT